MNPELLRQATLLDAAGIIPGKYESAEDFFSRAQRSFDVQRQLSNALLTEGGATVFDEIEIRNELRADPAILEEAAEVTDKLYGFRVQHVPGFFLSGSVGLLWGGCLIGDPDLDLAVFFLRDSFRLRKKWLFYDRTELAAHELCHSARTAMNEAALEEYFAYQTSSSKLRRYLGNCFIRDYDALLFVIPALFLPAAQFLQITLLPELPVWPFWIFALIYPVYLLIRNQKARNVVNRARKALKRCQVEMADAVLFRCVPQELEEISRLKERCDLEEYVNRKGERELRWQVIARRFIFPVEEQIYGQDQNN